MRPCYFYETIVIENESSMIASVVDTVKDSSQKRTI